VRQKPTSSPQRQPTSAADPGKARKSSKIEAEALPTPLPIDPGKPDRRKPAQSLPILLTEAEVAKRLRVSAKTLRNWRSLRKVPKFIKVEGQIRYRLADVIAFLKAGWSGSSARVSKRAQRSDKMEHKSRTLKPHKYR
jgi:hypothetical protein